MILRRIAALLVALTCGAALAAPAHAQSASAADDLLRLVPNDFAFCLSVDDLRGHWERVQKAGWFDAFLRSSAGKQVLASPELKDLARVEEALKTYLDVD